MTSSRHLCMSQLPSFLLVGAVLVGTRADAEKVTFDDHVYPVFEKACTNCHNPDKKKGDLDLTSYTATMAGGSAGKIAVPGDGGGSRIYAVITHTEEPVMPPEGEKLEKKDADMVRSWIDGGLLETRSSAAKKVERPKIDLVLDANPASKPEGPPPMPADLSLEPVVVGLRAGVVKDMAASPWAPLVAVTGQKQVLLYNTDTLRLAAVLPFPAGQPETLSFHPSGKYLIAGGGVAGKSGSTITWEIETGKEVLIAGKEFDSVLAAGVRPDLATVATGGPARLIKLWDSQTGEQLAKIKKHTDWVTALAFSPDGVLLATADRNGGAWVWEAGSGNEFYTLRGHSRGISAVTWRADSNVVATASEDGDVIFWEMHGGKQAKKIKAHATGVLAFDYARDGHFVTAGRDGKVKIWKPDFTLKKEFPAFGDMVVAVAFSHDGKRLFTADYNGKVEVWDSESFVKAGELDTNPPRIAARLAALSKQLDAAPAAIKSAGDKLKAAEGAVTEARDSHQAAVAKRDAARQKIAHLQQELDKLNAESTQLDKRKEILSRRRGEGRSSVAAAEKKLNSRQQDLEGARQELARTTATGNAATGKTRRLAEAARTARAQSDAEPDNADLGRKAEEAERQLAAHKSEIATTVSRDEDIENRISQFETQITASEAALAEARRQWTEIDGNWQALEKRQREIVARRGAVGPEIVAIKKSLPGLEKGIKPAQEAIAAREKQLPPLKKALEASRTREATIRKDVRFWQGASANAEALAVASQIVALRGEQDLARAEFKELSKKVGSLRKEMAAAGDRKQAQPVRDQLKATSSEIEELRTAIDQRAPHLSELTKREAALRARYAEMKQ